MTDEIGAKAAVPNPRLKPFEVLIGDWKTTGKHPYMPAVELHGRATYEWLENGAFLLLRSEIDHAEFPDGIEIFGSDDKAGTYYMLHFDERGTSRKYDVTIAQNQLKWWRDDPEFSQRFTMDIAKDKINIRGEMSLDGGEWEADLSMICEKV